MRQLSLRDKGVPQPATSEHDAPSDWRNRPYNPVRKLRAVQAGIRDAALSDFSVAYKIALSLIVLVPTVYWRHWVDAVVIVVVTAVMLSAELFNTAIEELCDYLNPRHDVRIRRIKDIAAAATGVTVLLWALVLLYEYASASTSLFSSLSL